MTTTRSGGLIADPSTRLRVGTEQSRSTDPERVFQYLSQTRLPAPEAQLMAGRAPRAAESLIRSSREQARACLDQ